MCRKRFFAKKEIWREKKEEGDLREEGGKTRKEGGHVNVVDPSSTNSSTLYFFKFYFEMKMKFF